MRLFSASAGLAVRQLGLCAPSPPLHRVDRVLQPAGGGAFAGFVEEGDREAHQAEGDFGVSGHGPTLPCRKPATCPGARRRFENRVVET